MNSTQIYRPRRRSSLLPLACGCLAAIGVIGVILVAAGVLFLPQIIGGLTGLTPQGSTSAVFAGVTPQPTVALQDPTDPAQMTVDLGDYGQQTLNNNQPQLYHFTLGTGSSGEQEAVVRFTEAGLMSLCQQRTTICSPNSSDPHFSNARIDLRPGGAVVYADAKLPQLGDLPLPAGIVLRWDAPTRQIAFAGVDINGTLYTTPPQGLGDTVNAIVQQINDVVQQLAVEMGGGRYSLADVQVDDSTLTVILR